MVKIKWIITDNIKDVDLKEFNTEWNGIYGHFELCINNQTVGFWPDRELFPGDENITDWLYELSRMIVQLGNSMECEWELLAMNLCKIVIKKEDMVVISLMYHHRYDDKIIWSEKAAASRKSYYDTTKIIWSEKVTSQELIEELMCAIDKFIVEVQACNADLLDSKIMREISDIRNVLSQTSI